MIYLNFKANAVFSEIAKGLSFGTLLQTPPLRLTIVRGIAFRECGCEYCTHFKPLFINTKHFAWSLLTGELYTEVKITTTHFGQFVQPVEVEAEELANAPGKKLLPSVRFRQWQRCPTKTMISQPSNYVHKKNVKIIKVVTIVFIS